MFITSTSDITSIWTSVNTAFVNLSSVTDLSFFLTFSFILFLVTIVLGYVFFHIFHKK